MKWLVKILLILALAYALVYTGALYLSHRSARRANLAWQQVHINVQSLLKKEPESEAQQAANIISNEAKQLGLHLEPKTEKHPIPSSVSRDMIHAVRSHLRTYLRVLFDRGDDSIDPLPETVTKYLDFHQDALNRFLAKIESLPDPVWFIDLKKGWMAPVPNYLDHLILHRLLMTWALHEYRQGNNEKAHRIVRAALRLNRGHARNPVLISQMMFEAFARLHMGVLRKIGRGDDLPDIDRRLYRDHTRFLQSLTVESWFFRELAWKPPRLSKSVNSGEHPLPKWSISLFPLFARATILDTSAHKIRLITRLAAETDPCTVNMKALLTEYRATFPRWNPFRRSDDGSWIAAWARHLLFTVEATLTERVLAIRSQASPETGWPPSLPDDGSSPCREAHFDYRILKDGSAWVGLSTKPAIYDTFPRLPLPLSHKLAPPQEPAESRAL